MPDSPFDLPAHTRYYGPTSMSTPVKHHTHGKVGRRRSHLAIKATNIHACSECKAPILPHRVCGNCGTMHTRALRKARAGQQPASA